MSKKGRNNMGLQSLDGHFLLLLICLWQFIGSRVWLFFLSFLFYFLFLNQVQNKRKPWLGSLRFGRILLVSFGIVCSVRETAISEVSLKISLGSRGGVVFFVCVFVFCFYLLFRLFLCVFVFVLLCQRDKVMFID